MGHSVALGPNALIVGDSLFALLIALDVSRASSMSANQSKGAIHVNEMMMLMLVLGLVLVLLLMIMMCRNDKSRRIVFMFLPAFLFFCQSRRSRQPSACQSGASTDAWC